jgi:hypothetical protein
MTARLLDGLTVRATKGTAASPEAMALTMTP